MQLIASVLVGLVAVEHLYILWVEMFAWTTAGKKMFRSVPPDLIDRTKAMAANQGLYNGFLAAGLLWSLLIANPVWRTNVASFFLSCVIVAGVYGAVTVHRSIFIKQALPALIALLFVVLAA